jgi:hypothetical protein
MNIDDAVFPEYWTIRTKQGQKACVYEESCRSKTVSFKMTKHNVNLPNQWASELGFILRNMPK